MLWGPSEGYGECTTRSPGNKSYLCCILSWMIRIQFLQALWTQQRIKSKFVARNCGKPDVVPRTDIWQLSLP